MCGNRDIIVLSKSLLLPMRWHFNFRPDATISSRSTEKLPGFSVGVIGSGEEKGLLLSWSSKRKETGKSKEKSDVN